MHCAGLIGGAHEVVAHDRAQMNFGAIGLATVPLGGDTFESTSGGIGVVDRKRTTFHPLGRLQASNGAEGGGEVEKADWLRDAGSSIDTAAGRWGGAPDEGNPHK